jgi:hypothetical protein
MIDHTSRDLYRIMQTSELNARQLEHIIAFCVTIDSISGDTQHLQDVIARFRNPECYEWLSDEEKNAAINCVMSLCDAIVAAKRYFDNTYTKGPDDN